MTTKTEPILHIRESAGESWPTEKQVRYAEHLIRELNDPQGIKQLIEHRTSGRASTPAQMTRKELSLLIDWLKGDIEEGITPEDRIRATKEQQAEIKHLMEARGMTLWDRTRFIRAALPNGNLRYPLSQRDAATIIDRLRSEA